jgi:hypothetical protein
VHTGARLHFLAALPACEALLGEEALDGLRDVLRWREPACLCCRLNFVCECRGEMHDELRGVFHHCLPKAARFTLAGRGRCLLRDLVTVVNTKSLPPLAPIVPVPLGLGPPPVCGLVVNFCRNVAAPSAADRLFVVILIDWVLLDHGESSHDLRSFNGNKSTFSTFPKYPQAYTSCVTIDVC